MVRSNFLVHQTAHLTTMTGLLDLSNELLVTIVNHITKPSDKLHFALLNKQSCERIIPFVYQHIIFDSAEYPSPRTPKTRVSKHRAPSPKTLQALAPGPPCSNFVRLTNKLSSRYQSHGVFPHRIHALTIKIEADNEGNELQIAFCKILSFLPYLTHLHFEYRGKNGQHWPESFSFAPLAQALSPLSGTLRSLTVYVAGKDITSERKSDGWTIGSLRHFHNLKALSMQVSGFMGNDNGEIFMADLNELLPPKLQNFKLYWPSLFTSMLIGVLVKWLVVEAQQPWTFKTITMHVDEKSTAVDADFWWPAIQKIREQARTLGGNVDLKLILEKDYY